LTFLGFPRIIGCGMSAPWNNLAQDEVAIVHISDLHLGSPKSEDVWRSVSAFLQDAGKLKPDLILVTGDLVHTPNKNLYNKAKDHLDNLRIPYLICAGNHDRHGLGNKRGRFFKFRASTSSDFDQTFAGKILLPNEAVERSVGSGAASWKIGLIGLDSSLEADWSARGFIPEGNFANLERTTREKDWDLCICLVHHHVLSIRNLEHKRQASLKSLFDLTCLVNSGSLLEALAHAQVDLVLHGHEHESNWATYGTFSPGRSQVRVVGAGSATGNNSLTGCDLFRASFNLIVLSPSRSGRLRRLAFRSNEWMIEDEISLFDSATTRHSRIRRAQNPEQAEIKSEITKYVEFTRERSIEVSWVYTNWLPGVRFEQEVTNSSGVLEDIEVWLAPPNGTPTQPDDAKINWKRDYTWTISWTVPDPLRGLPLTMAMSYRWRGGAVLTKAELQTVQDGNAPGPLRKGGLEFSTIWAPVAVAAVELIVTLPPEYAPDPQQLKLIIEEGEMERQQEAAELLRQLRTLAPGVYALRIPYPRKNCFYQIAWPPITKPFGETGEMLVETARHSGEELLRTFGRALQSTSLEKDVSLGLYVKAANEMSTELVGHVALGNEGGAARRRPQSQVPLKGDRVVLA
jgi:3',5'-cyclic AMP phosphodiesterase CpdA